MGSLFWPAITISIFNCAVLTRLDILKRARPGQGPGTPQRRHQPVHPRHAKEAQTGTDSPLAAHQNKVKKPSAMLRGAGRSGCASERPGCDAAQTCLRFRTGGPHGGDRTPRAGSRHPGVHQGL
ncbi:hypothetical protein IMZ48_27240 [Candidatus Bathyarchaeota archaeon]|nr:hypothetical protein [Candidatus Bathyarchaeota archaeon]